MSNELHSNKTIDQKTEHNKIGLSTATIVGMNAMIGAGIFTAPAALSSNVGPAGILAYAFVIIAVWLMALSISKVAQLFPGEGSFYSYAKELGGPVLGILTTASYLIGLVIAMGLLSQVAGDYLNYYIPTMSSQNLGLLALGVLVILNLIGVKLSEAGQIILIILTVTPILIITIIGFMRADLSNLTPFAPFGFRNVISATKAVIFGFFGFECAASLYSVVKDPAKNVPKALTYSIFIVGLLYLAFVSSIIISIPLSEFTHANIKLPEILLKVLPAKYNIVIKLVGFSILSAILGTLHSMIWSSGVLLSSLFNKIKMPIVQRITRSKYNNQISVLIISSLILSTSLLLKNLDLFFNFTALFIIISFMITIMTLVVKSKSLKDITIAVIGLATASMILYFAIEGIIKELA